MRLAWGNDPDDLIAWATSADARKHTDTLEAERHYLDVDDLQRDSVDVWGNSWSDHVNVLADSTLALSPRRYGVLPWQLEWSYLRLVQSLTPRDSMPISRERALRAAADLGHYLADAHVPLHTSGNYNGQRTGQRGIHALWETQAVEWMLNHELRTCSCSPGIAGPPYDPVWTPWEVLHESHMLVPDVFSAHLEWDSLCGMRGYGFQRRGRTLQLTPTPEALQLWDSLTSQTTWPRFCLASQRIASAWTAAWVEAGRPELNEPEPTSFWKRVTSYLPWP